MLSPSTLILHGNCNLVILQLVYVYISYLTLGEHHQILLHYKVIHGMLTSYKVPITIFRKNKIPWNIKYHYELYSYINPFPNP
jgi:hypothetical protein